MKTLTAPRPALRRVTGYTLIAAAAFTLAAQAAVAQEAPPPDNAPGATQNTGNTDPPGRVARLNYTSGAVTTEPAGATDWSYAQINRPLTTGDQLWNDQNARAELHIGSTAVRLGDVDQPRHPQSRRHQRAAQSRARHVVDPRARTRAGLDL